MFSRVFVATLALAVTTCVAQRGHGHGHGHGHGGGDCNIGSIHCCNSATSNSGTTDSTSAGLLSGILTGVIPIVPVTCIPVDVLIGLGTFNCNGQTVCCEDSEFNGIPILNCTPLNVAV